MSNLHKTKIRVSPAIFLLMALFVLCSSEVLLCAILLAALFHELGHYLVLRRIGAKIGSLYISVFGAEIRIDNRRQLSYGDEMLAAAAGPVCNLVWALLFAWIGCKAEVLYLFSGAQLVLGVFNLLPVKPLAGGARRGRRGAVAGCGSCAAAGRRCGPAPAGPHRA
ncbi:MAG: hypothetical protein GXW99_05775, partial [Clostridiales bacterium]|nr:hypothetical protein [Clostridiales bacterium]